MSIASGSTPERRAAPGLGRFALLLGIAAALQTAVLAWMIYDRVSLVRQGREVVLETAPIDPRSLFRGDYVILNYKISALDAKELAGEDAFRRAQRVFVTLQKDDTGADAGRLAAWKAVSIAGAFPADAGDNRVVIRGEVRSTGRLLRIKYGIESYFVPEGEGRRLEKLARTGNMQVLVAVGRNGEAAIKGLLIDGKLRYEESLF